MEKTFVKRLSDLPLRFFVYSFFLLIIFGLTGSSFAQTITVVSPNGGEKFISNDSKNIVWKSSDVQNVKIEYSIDDGINWNIVTSSFPAFLRSYVWTLPTVSSSQVIIKISDASNNLILDLSDYVFDVNSAPFQNQDSRFDNSSNMNALSGTLDLTFPDPTSNGGIVLEASTGTIIRDTLITWTSSGVTNSIDIEYSINGGDNWNTIANVSASTVSYNWTIPSSIQPSTQLVIRIKETGGGGSNQNQFYVFMKNPQTFANTTIKILPFGDSITHGRNGGSSDTQAGNNAGYEFKLWDLLRMDDYNFDFIGNKYSGYNYFPDYQNAGFPGYTTAAALSILTDGHTSPNSQRDDTFASGPYLDSGNFPSDIVLIHIGTNDFGSISPTAAAANVEAMLDNIHTISPNTWVILAKILEEDPPNSDIAAFNGLIEGIARNKIGIGGSNDYNILIVDMFNIPGFNYTTGGDLNDDVHPNASGYAKMAQVWYDALKLILPPGTATAPAFTQSTVNISANVNIPLNYQAVASGIGTPEYSFDGATPTGMKINKYTGKIKWTPTVTTVSPIQVKIQATNPPFTPATQTLNINVYETSNKPSNLVLNLNFNNPQGTMLFEDQVDTNDAGIEGILSMADGRIDKAASFSGSFSKNKAYILQNENVDFVSPGKFTVEAWIRPSTTSGDQAVVGQYSGDSESHWWLGLSDGKPTFRFHEPGTDVDIYKHATASNAVTTGQWYHIAGVKDNSNLKIYVNGVVTTGEAASGDVKTLRPIDIGNYQNTKYYNGLIDNIAIYDAALDANAILNHYKDGIYSVQTNVTAFLQGPYNGTDMNTNLRTLSSFPVNQPYSANPWNYPGKEGITALPPPANVVDWVLLELRTGTAASTIVSKRAAFLKNGGSIVGLDGTSPINLYGVLPGKYYITVKHRNHLAVMTKDPLELKSSTAVSFSFNDQTKVRGTNPMVSLTSGNWGMWAGDANGDGLVTSTDFNIFNPKFISATSGYEAADWNMDGQVTSTDFNIFNPNFISAKSTQVP